ncbi:MAG: hypothetical protein U0T77_10700 [Chitinophagales bacterium]
MKKFINYNARLYIIYYGDNTHMNFNRFYRAKKELKLCDMGVTKDMEQRLAYIYYVEKHKTAKESAQLSGVSEKTLNNWVEKFGWKKLRDALLNSTKNQVSQIKELISLLTQRRLRIEAQISEVESKRDVNDELLVQLREQCIGIGDEVSKWNKTLENVDKANRINLSVYLEVMEDVFTQMQVEEPELHMKTLGFQQSLIQKVSLKYG